MYRELSCGELFHRIDGVHELHRRLLPTKCPELVGDNLCELCNELGVVGRSGRMLHGMSVGDVLFGHLERVHELRCWCVSAKLRCGDVCELLCRHNASIDRVAQLQRMPGGVIQPEHGCDGLCELPCGFLSAWHLIDRVCDVQRRHDVSVRHGILLELCRWYIFRANGSYHVSELLCGYLSKLHGRDELFELSCRHVLRVVFRECLRELPVDDVLLGVVVSLHELLGKHVHLLHRIDIVQQLRDERGIRDRIRGNDVQRHRSHELV